MAEVVRSSRARRRAVPPSRRSASVATARRRPITLTPARCCANARSTSLPAWEPDLAEARARYEALDAGDFGSAVEHAREWRLADPFSGFFLPLPPVAQALFSAHGSWRLGDGDPHERPDSVALDASGRPVAHVLERGGGFERAKHLWWWDQDGSLLEIELLGGGPHVRRARAIDGRWAHIATVSASVDETVQTLTWRDGRAVRSDVASVYADGGGWASARTAEFDADGRLLRIREIP